MISRLLGNITFFLVSYLSLCSAQETYHYLKKPENFFTTLEKEILRERLLLKAVIPKGLYLIGHRGMGSTNNTTQQNLKMIPENTLESFKHAILSGADGLEFDIFETRDGHLLIIHDDELWKNVHNMNRSGLHLPFSETQQSFRVSQKDLVDLIQLSVGSREQKPPTLGELIELVEEANAIRHSLQMPPLFLNVDVKNFKVSLKCYEWIERYLQKNDKTSINFSYIYFTSPDLEALRCLYETALLHHRSVNTVLQVTTVQIYGKENTCENYLVKNPSDLNREYLEWLQKWIRSYHIKGIDCILWDLNLPLLDLCKNNRLELHIYSSDFKLSNGHQRFGSLICALSQFLPVYLKTDHLQEKLSILASANLEKPKTSKELCLKHYFPLEKPVPN